VSRITIKQVETFALVAQIGSFSAAADRLGVSSAAVSDHVRALERKIGYPLFDRRRGTVPELNENGRAFLTKASDLLSAASEVEQLSDRRAAQRIRVGAGDYVLDHLLLPNLPHFQRQHPATHIEFVRLGSSQEAQQATSAQKMDLAYVAGYAPPGDPAAEVIGASVLRLFASPDHPVVAATRAGKLTTLPMLMPLSGTAVERTILQMLEDADIHDFEVVTRAQHHNTLIELACAGVGVACLMLEHAQGALSKQRLVDLGFCLPPLYRLAYRRPNALDSEYVRQVDQFAVSLVKNVPVS
jgi:DNA-binding transcriptional LysR family regulator